MEQWRELVKKYGLMGLIGVVGLGLVGYGVWEAVKPREVVVEIIRNQEVGSSDKSGQLVVDVAGAVEAPGVYRLQTGSRIGDALVAAGGLAATADRVWVAQTLNLAKEIKDQEKIFIPGKYENNNQAPNSNNQTSSNNQVNKLLNINTASAGELDRLPGIGEVRAKAIIDNRPYGSIEELVSKAKIPQSIYEDLVNLVRVY